MKATTRIPPIFSRFTYRVFLVSTYRNFVFFCLFFEFQNPSFSDRADAKWSLRDRQTRVWWTDGNRDVLQDTRVVLHSKQGASEPGWIISRNVGHLCHDVSLLALKNLQAPLIIRGFAFDFNLLDGFKE